MDISPLAPFPSPVLAKRRNASPAVAPLTEPYLYSQHRFTAAHSHNGQISPTGKGSTGSEADWIARRLRFDEGGDD